MGPVSGEITADGPCLQPYAETPPCNLRIHKRTPASSFASMLLHTALQSMKQPVARSAAWESIASIRYPLHSVEIQPGKRIQTQIMSSITCCMPATSPRAMCLRGSGRTLRRVNLGVSVKASPLVVRFKEGVDVDAAHKVAHKDVDMAAKKNGCVFEKIGGKDAMATAVDRFYDKVIADDRVNHFFKNTDMKAQRAKQVRRHCFWTVRSGLE